MKRKRRTHSPEFKAKVALAAAQGDMTMPELVKKFDVHANQITEWKKQLLSSATDVFGKGAKKVGDEGHQVNRKRVQRLMLTMGLTTLYPKRNLSLAFSRGWARGSRFQPNSTQPARWRAIELIIKTPSNQGHHKHHRYHHH